MDDPEHIIAAAIFAALEKSPDAGHGTTWPKIYQEPAITRTFAKVIVQELTKAGYQISKGSPNA